MTLILRGAYTHRVAGYDLHRVVGIATGKDTLVTDCGMPVSFFDRLGNATEREAAKAVDCPGCLRARTKEMEALL